MYDWYPAHFCLATIVKQFFCFLYSFVFIRSCQFVEPFFKNPISNLTSSERQLIVETDRNAPDCSCSQSFLDCPAGASGSTPPAWTMNTSDILLDISLKPDLNRYLVRTVRDYRWKRYSLLRHCYSTSFPVVCNLAAHCSILTPGSLTLKYQNIVNILIMAYG